MFDPGLKLPLRIKSNALNGFNFFLIDGDDQPLELTKHQGEVIVAALTADAERQAHAESGEKQCTCLTNQLGPDYCARCQA